MKKNILSILIFSLSLLMIGAMSGCTPREQPPITPEDAEMILYNSDTVVNGEFYINAKNDITISLPIFSNSEYDVAQEYYNENIELSVDHLVGTNTNSIDCKITDTNIGGASPLSNDKYSLSAIDFNISTIIDSKETVTISLVKLKIDDKPYEINTDITVYIVPDAEFIQAEEGTLLFYSLGADYSKALLKGYMDSSFRETFYFNKQENYLTHENDSIEFDEFTFSHKDNISITDTVYGFNSDSNLKASNGSMDDAVKSAFNIIFKATITGNGKDVNYFSLAVRYHFSFDPTIHTVVLGYYVNSNSNQIMDNFVNKI